MVTATDVRSPAASFATKSVALDSVICSSSSDKMPLALGYPMTLLSLGMEVMRHSGGMEAAMRAFFSAATSCQVIFWFSWPNSIYRVKIRGT